ncbi:hypothetical protein OROGR_024724 [Orobanche gracilis]
MTAKYVKTKLYALETNSSSGDELVGIVITMLIGDSFLTQRSKVPTFGNWENEDDVPYTVYFEKARKKRGENTFNPNDPQENLNMFRSSDRTSLAQSNVRPTTPEHKKGDIRRSGNLSPRSENITHLRNGGREQKAVRPERPNVGSDQNFGRSPLHPQYHQGKVVMGRRDGSSAWEGRNRDSSHGNAGRSWLRPSLADGSPDKGAAVPRFGEWNENDPESAEKFTHIFNKVRNERNTVIGNPSATPKHPSYDKYKQPSDEPKKCCFPWW